MAINHPGPAVGILIRKLQQNWRWSKAHRWAHLIEEHDLNPMIRGKRAVRKAWWRLVHRAAIVPAVPVFLVGVQRSGTNLLAHGLDEMPEFQVFNEGNGKAFDEYHLRPLPTIEQLIRQSGAKFVLFKPLCDSHRTPEMLAHFAPQARAIWAYRNVDGRVRSAVAKFGESNLRVLRAFAAGEKQRPWNAWQVQGLSDESASFIRSLDFNCLTAESAAALFWYVRNLLYFEMALDRRPDTVLANYDEFLAEPERVARALCNFLEQPYRREMIAHVDSRRPAQRAPLPIDQRIRERCSDLKKRLDEVCAAQMSKLAGDRSIRLSGSPVQPSRIARPQQG
jgi:sulfotransferase family protein